jgi:hypothetical protein
MNSFNLAPPTSSNLKPADQELVEHIRNIPSQGGSLNYSSKGAANYVKAIQEGKISEVLKNFGKNK